jgi:hypothetical protein
MSAIDPSGHRTFGVSRARTLFGRANIFGMIGFNFGIWGHRLLALQRAIFH